MIELYVLITLLGLGYVINQNKSAELAKAEQPPLSQAPSLNKQYLPRVQQQEANKSKTMYQESLKPGSNVVNRVKMVKSQLSGVPTKFTHTNMQPFFRGNMTQNTNAFANKSILENYTGVNDLQFQKSEVQPFFQPQKDPTGNIYGAQSSLEYEQEYLVKPKLQNNVLPFTQIRVGPGTGQGYSSAPIGGFQQFDIQEQVRQGFKDTDDLRVADKPKVSYEARAVDGKKGSNRGIVAPLEKNRVETFFEQTPDMLIKTTGAQLKESQYPTYDAKYTTRVDTTSSYYGTATNQTKEVQGRPDVRSTSKSQLEAFGIVAPNLGYQGVGQKHDYGKANILVYSNERDLTTVKTHQGNVTSVIKAIVAPLIDIIKPSKKALDTEHPRSFGSLQPQLPSKLTMHDTNDVTRTTIKETLIHDADKGNLSGPKKNVVYDTNAIARTTLKQTLLHDSDHLNLKGKRLGIAKGEQVAKTTGRQTVDPVDTMVNLASNSRRGTVQNNDAARTTIKQTVNVDRDGNIESLAKANAGYKNESFEMKETEKQYTSAIERVGQAGQNKNDGYKNAAYDAKETQKEHDSNNEYFGTAQNGITAQTSYEEYDNVVIDDLKESILYGRAPTQTGVKTSPGMEIVNLDVKKLAVDEPADRETLNAERIVNIDKNYAQLAEEALTRLPQEYDSADRLDISILSALKDNEFALKLN